MPNRIIHLLAALVCIAVLAQAAAAATGTMAIVEAEEKKADTHHAQTPNQTPDPDASPAELKAMLPTMSDAQARRLLVQELDRRAAEQQAASEDAGGLAESLTRLRDAGDFVRHRFSLLFSAAGSAPRALPGAWKNAFGLHGRVSPWMMLLGVAVLTLLHALACLLLRLRTHGLRLRLADAPEDAAWTARVGRLGLRALLDVAGLVLVSAVVLAVWLLLAGEHPEARALVLAWLAAMVLWGLWNAVSRFFLAPRAPRLRFLPLSDAAAAYMHRWAVRLGLVVALGLLTAGLLRLEHDSAAVHLLVLSGFGLAVTLLLCGLFLTNRRAVAEHIRSQATPGSLRWQFAGAWHALAVAYVLLFWAVWVLGLVLFGASAAWSGLAALLCVPAYLVLDWLAQRLVDHATAKAEEREESARVSRIRRVLSVGFRVGIAAALFFWLLSLYGVDMPLGADTARALLDILVTLVLAYLFWVWASAAIERRIRAGQPEGEEDEESEGGHGGDRLTTLLQLMRKFLLALLLAVTGLIMLSSMGVAIGPLLAGASIFGIAIGFGSQTLVRDIVSGVFFLLDDAFRVGDYLEVGSAKGTVERLSIRAMQLRHHLGMVYTIPYGHITQVKNLTRDYSIMKLQFHVPFDTDIAAVKKIVKRIDKEIREVPEFAGVLLSKIKSQGVKSIDEVGMLMRIKFTTKPGGQFSVRKAVLAKLRAAFEEAGIQFAHRKVTVHVAQEDGQGRADPAAAGAAAARAALDGDRNGDDGQNDDQGR